VPKGAALEYGTLARLIRHCFEQDDLGYTLLSSAEAAEAAEAAATRQQYHHRDELICYIFSSSSPS
jgi:hypothetical protein